MVSDVLETVKNGLSTIADSRVLVTGDVMLDRYWFGSVDRISPEAPVPVISVESRDERVGGAGNVARNIAALNGKSSLLALVGDDEAGRCIKTIAEQDGIETGIMLDASMETTIKLRMMSRNQQLLRADFEKAPEKESQKNLCNEFQKRLSGKDAVVLSDYGKGSLGLVQEMISSANEHDVPVFVDPKGRDYSIYRGASVITPNLKEFELATGESVVDDAHLQRLAKNMISDLGIDAILVTLSERGMMLIRKDNESLHRPARTREVYDVSGAGDTVIAVMAMALSKGMSDDDALILSNACAGVVVSKLGTATASPQEVLAMTSRQTAEENSQ